MVRRFPRQILGNGHTGAMIIILTRMKMKAKSSWEHTAVYRYAAVCLAQMISLLLVVSRAPG